MKIQRTYKTELKVNNKQSSYLMGHVGAARHVYNWGLEQRINEYKETGKSSNAIAQHRQLNGLKKGEKSWLYEYSKAAPQEALRDLDKAFSSFFRRVKQKKKGSFVKVGFSKFKKRKEGSGSFRLTGAIHIEGDRIKLPRIGWLRLHESGYLPVGVKPKSVTVSLDVDKWYVSILVEEELSDCEVKEQGIGIDVGLKELAVCSDGERYENIKSLKKHERKLKLAQRELSRRKKGGKNRKKSIIKVQKVHRKIRNVRTDYIQKVTSQVARAKSPDLRPSFIVVEDLNIAGMMKNSNLSKSVADASMQMFHRMLEYKCGWYGIDLIKADRWYPSSKRCNDCGAICKELKLSEREWACVECGVVHDRDMNAALNLKDYPFLNENNTASSVGINAFGENVSLSDEVGAESSLVELGIKQETITDRFL
jgi:putative transposase